MTLVALLACVAGLAGLDTWLGHGVARLLGASHVFSQGAANLPDLLLPFSACVTAASWAAFFILRRRKGPTPWIELSRVVGTAVPVAFVLKEVLKWAVGRTNSRAWLSDPSLYGFHWFSGGGDFSGFPSGHMAVATPLCLLLAGAFPRWRRWYITLLVLLGIALVITGHHFFSDVIAGAWTGWMVQLLVSPRHKRD